MFSVTLYLILISNLTVCVCMWPKNSILKCVSWYLDIISQFAESLSMWIQSPSKKLRISLCKAGGKLSSVSLKVKIHKLLYNLNGKRKFLQYSFQSHFPLFLSTNINLFQILSPTPNCLRSESYKLIWTETNFWKKKFHGNYRSCWASLCLYVRLL